MSALIILNPQRDIPVSPANLAMINSLIQQQWDCVVRTSKGLEHVHPELEGAGVSVEEVAAFKPEPAIYIRKGGSIIAARSPITATMRARDAKTIRIYCPTARYSSGSAFDGESDGDVSLLTQLQDRKINRVTICGFTDILATAMHAHKNFQVSVYAEPGPSQIINEDLSRWQREFTFI